MYLLFLLLLPSVVLSKKLSVEENEELKANCGAHYLKRSGMIPKNIGTPVERNTFPWMAAIEYFVGNYASACSAVQVSSRHILTAAHCVLDMVNDTVRKQICREVKPDDRGPEFPSRIIKGTIPPENFIFYASSSCDGYPFQCRRDEIKFRTTKLPRVHEEFDPCMANNDLALVELDQDIPSTVGSPICMIEKDERVAEELTAIGYGDDPKHPHPKKLGLNRLEMMKIDSAHVEEISSRAGHIGKLKASLDGKSTCHGDSGGPLVQLDQNGKYSVIGIASSIYPDCSERNPRGPTIRVNSFIDLRYHTDWICTHTGICPIKEKSQRYYLHPLLKTVKRPF